MNVTCMIIQVSCSTAKRASVVAKSKWNVDLDMTEQVQAESFAYQLS
jgi:hypothetical protein